MWDDVAWELHQRRMAAGLTARVAGQWAARVGDTLAVVQMAWLVRAVMDAATLPELEALERQASTLAVRLQEDVSWQQRAQDDVDLD